MKATKDIKTAKWMIQYRYTDWQGNRIKSTKRMFIELKKQRNVTEKLKEKNQMLWVKEMNNISDCVDEIIRKEIIFN